MTAEYSYSEWDDEENGDDAVIDAEIQALEEHLHEWSSTTSGGLLMRHMTEDHSITPTFDNIHFAHAIEHSDEDPHTMPLGVSDVFGRIRAEISSHDR